MVPLQNGEESEACIRAGFPRWGNPACFRNTQPDRLLEITEKKMLTIGYKSCLLSQRNVKMRHAHEILLRSRLLAEIQIFFF